MKFPYAMLRDFVDTSLSAEQLGDLLTMAGFELEGIEEADGDAVLDIKVMSNRGDGLSVFGLAREVLAKDPEARATPLYDAGVARRGSLGVSQSTSTSVIIETPECTRYACLTLANVTKRESEPWMQRRLSQAGMRPISLMVDITNYVMLELGQPLHAFDLAKLTEGRIVVRKARSGEKLTTLNGIEHELQTDQMMICDAVKPVACAGVMGGLDTEVTLETTSILLESAHFNNVSVRRTRKQLGLSTEASYRFERSVDPEGVVAAIERCVELLKTVDPGIVSTEIVDVYPTKPVETVIGLRTSRASKLLGMPLTHTEAHSYLTRLGFRVDRKDDDTFLVHSPSWRPDIVREEDLVEELGRVHGYEKIPERHLEGTTKMGGAQGPELWTDWLREAAVRAGLTQIISHSLRDLHPLDETSGARIGPRTPASPDTAYLRNSLLPCLSDAARRNNAKDVHLFEIGRVFQRLDGVYAETQRLGLLSVGPLLPATWTAPDGASAGFFSLKGRLEAALLEVGVSASFETPATPDERLHPTRQAVVSVKGKTAGVLGQIHPNVAKECGLSEETILAELGIEALFEGRNLELPLRSVSRHPAVRRDMSVLVDKSVTYERLAELIQRSGGSVLESMWLFDEFAGQGIPEGKHALGIALQLRKSDSTFTDEEANLVRDRVVSALAEFGATTR